MLITHNIYNLYNLFDINWLVYMAKDPNADIEVSNVKISEL